MQIYEQELKPTMTDFTHIDTILTPEY